jgi:purine-binding chemotaxis protein CheW
MKKNNDNNGNICSELVSAEELDSLGLECFDLTMFSDEESYEDAFDEAGEVDKNLLQLLCFNLADEEYAIDIMNMKEIIKLREFTEVPRSPDFITGVISLRGVIIPVFDLRKRLGLEAKEYDRNTRIIIAKDNNKNWGMVVDEVLQVIRIPEESLEPPPPVISGISAEFITGIGKYENRFAIIMNLKNVLDIDI